MLKRILTHLLLLHVLSAICVFSPADIQPPEIRGPGGGTDAACGLSAGVEEAEPLLDFIGDLLSGTQQNTQNKDDNFSDFFRTRKYNYRFWEGNTFAPEPSVLLPVAAVSVLSSRAYSPFGGLLTRPDYYRLLFRLTPF